MAFKKDGETKVYKAKSGTEQKNASESNERYTVDDLVRDSEEQMLLSEGSDEEDVSNKD